MKRLALYLFLVPGAATVAQAVEPDEILADPQLEARARDISRGLRCVVCQNQDIDSSNAGVARDLRLLVRERLVAGDSDDDVIAYVRARYGDYVLMSPPLTPATFALWGAPFILSGIGMVFFIALTRRQGSAQTRPLLSDDEEKQVDRFLDRGSEEDTS